MRVGGGVLTLLMNGPNTIISIVNMNYLEIEPSIVHLQGITRSSYFKITNRNDFLAVSFSITVQHPSPNLLKVFPDQGILLGGEHQRIRVKVGSDDNSICEEGEVTYALLVRFTYKTQYNKRYLIKNSMKGWHQLANEVFQKEVRIISAGERQAIQDYIKEQINFEKKFGTDQLNLSAIKIQQEQAGNDSSLNLDISSRFDDKEAKTVDQRPTREQLNSSLQVDQIIPLDFGESRTKQNAFMKKASSKQANPDQIIESKLIKQDLSKSFSISMKTAQKNSFSQDGSIFSNSTDSNKNKTLDLIILAIISAFFVALGSNIKRVIG